MGATTVWERWNSILPDGSFNTGSLNHFAFGAIGSWLFSKVAGIDQAKASVGYKDIVIKPHLARGLSFANGAYNSMYGSIRSGWKVSGNQFSLAVEIPANTTATIYLPCKKTDAIREGNRALDKIKDIKTAVTDNGWIAVTIGSGQYNFSCPMP